jgi:acyl transferase domain-containing protein
MNSYIFNNLLPRPDVLNQVGGYQLMLASDKDFLATRTSYKLNLRGPAVTVQTACSTSLVAVQMACQSLLNYQCDIALAGGVSVGSPRVGGYVYQPGMIMSPDGHCRPFDARGQGIVAGEGAGIVVLKRLSEALADGDAIRAVILGAAINNDGSDKVGFTAPSVGGQSEAITMAQAMAGVSPDSIQYVEAHGTGTELGDPIEIAALTQAFRLGTERRSYCAIGSVKSNMGHLDDAAGIAGLIKTMLALQHRQIPPSLHFEKPNPNIEFGGSPFYVATELADWPRLDTPRRAGVSSFGIGGTNAHAVLEEAPPQAAAATSRRQHLLLLSALTPTALDKATAALAAHLEAHPELDLADVAYTLQVGRKTFGQRHYLVCTERGEAIRRLAGHAEQPLPSSGQDTRR